MLYLPHIFNQLASRAGYYEGPGVDGEQGQLGGRLTIDAMQAGGGIAVALTATRGDGIIYHDERSLILGGASTYVALMNTFPRVNDLALHAVKTLDDGGSRCMFRRGDIARKSTLPIALAIDLWTDGDIGFSYSWGLAGQPYRVQLSAHMQKVQ